MDINELKSNWQKSTGPRRDANELAAMTSIGNHPQLKRIRVKLVTESALLVLLLFTYYNAFDGDQRPVWLNAMFVVSSLAYVLNDVISFLNITRLTRGKDILSALHALKRRLQRMKMLSLISSTVFGLSLIALLSWGVALTTAKMAIVCGMLATLIASVYFSYHNWNRRIGQLTESINGFLRDNQTV